MVNEILTFECAKRHRAARNRVVSPENVGFA